ncbi:MAG: amidohydrolase [Clostridiales Family XIII bacterium]|jgi:predicted amidohydrolase YtcJ|nr:amidohydrolase [Clostridiales Family XIII bacterium]
MSVAVYDAVYRGGTVITVNQNEDIADWVAVKDGKIAAVGAAGDEPKANETVELEGAVLLPGLYDAHCHIMPTGFFLDSVNLLETKSVGEVLRLLEKRCAQAGKGEWVFGAGFMAQNMQEGRFPNRFELDSVSGDHPVLLTAQTLHGGTLNTIGLRHIRLPDVAGVGRDADGSPDGTLLSDDAFFSSMSQVMALLPKDKLKAFIANCADYARKKGVTSIVGLLGQFVDGDTDVEIVERDRAEFPVNIVTFYQTWDFEKIKKYNLPRIGGCLTLDGAGFEYTMALQNVYPDRPERRGFLIHTDEEIYTLISRAHREGIQTAFHALGDRAIDQLLFVFRQVIGEQGNKDLRHRVEHFSLPWDIHMDMLAEMKLVASMQPAFTGLWGEPEKGYYDLLLGRERASRMEVFPEILKRGGIVCGGSDSPVTLVDPLYGIACCIANPDPRRNISVHDALKIFTLNAAYSVHQDGQKGSVEVGKDADFTVIDRNPYDCAGREEICGMRTLMTVKDAKITFRA